MMVRLLASKISSHVFIQQMEVNVSMPLVFNGDVEFCQILNLLGFRW